MRFKDTLLSTSRLNKKLIVLFCDLLSICIATLFALVISDVHIISLGIKEYLSLSWIPFLSVLVFWQLGVYSSIVRYIDLTVMFVLAKAIFLLLLLSIFSKVLHYYFLLSLTNESSESIVTLEGWLVGLISFSLLVISTRLAGNYLLRNRSSEKKVIIYGAGSAGLQLASALRVSKEMQPIAFIDNNTALHGTNIAGIKVLKPSSLEKLCQRGEVDEVLIAMPSAPKSNLKNLLKEVQEYSIKVRILPGLAELAQGKVSVSELKEVDISDLLGRYEVEPNQALINRNIENKVVLITGAGGSIGSEISRQVVRNNPSKVILLDSNEYGLYSITNELQSYGSHLKLYSVLANVTNKKRITDICQTFGVDTIFHAAAYKHVPLVEENPFEAIYNNIIGTKVCAEAAVETNVETFVLISTDKAVRPTNIMGATKRFAELILQALSNSVSTRMIMVRFGNVIGSSGSAIPLFQEQIKKGGPVTVTHPDVTRYFMSIPEAAELVIQAGAMGKGGDVFVLDMGEPVKIYELARRLINLSGMEVRDEDNPNGDIEIVFTGLRPGEKLFEELLIGDKVTSTEHKQILRAEEEYISPNRLEEYLTSLREAEKSGNVSEMLNIFKEVVLGFTPHEEVVDVLYQNHND